MSSKLELHTWGPGFGLPSFEPQCLAAIAYLQCAVPAGSWVLVPCSDPAMNPTNELPSLLQGDIWIGGLRNIQQYLAQYSSGQWTTDTYLPEKEAADCISLSAFVESQAQPLLDLSLYVSSQNYTVTRAIYPTIQPFPLTYITPSAHRAAAKCRTRYLGFSSLDIDDNDQETSHRTYQGSVIPDSLRRQTLTISSMLEHSPDISAQIRLVGLADAFLSRIERTRNGKEFLIADIITSVDCLTFGFLCLMIYPDLRQPWLRLTITKKFPSLARWVQRLRDRLFGDCHPCSASTKDGVSVPQSDHTILPWVPARRIYFLDMSSLLFAKMFYSIRTRLLLRSRSNQTYNERNTQNTQLAKRSKSILLTGGLLMSIALGLAWLYKRGMINMPLGLGHVKSHPATMDYGAAGALLGLRSLQTEAASKEGGPTEQHDPLLEVAVDVESRRSI